jgi:SAM-dependent methyltransferase
MVAIATERAAARGLAHVHGRVLDLEDIAEPDASYDVVVCRDGLMFATDPARAVGEIARVLRPGGRVAVAVWGPRDANPWLGLAFDAVTAVTGFPVPPPGVPGPFALADADHLAGLLAAAGADASADADAGAAEGAGGGTGAGVSARANRLLVDVAVAAVDVPMATPSFDAWWTRTRAVAGPLARILAGLPDDSRHAIEDHARAATARHARPDGSLVLPGLNLVAGARRA